VRSKPKKKFLVKNNGFVSEDYSINSKRLLLSVFKFNPRRFSSTKILLNSVRAGKVLDLGLRK
jgi:hypothetical protein